MRDEKSIATHRVGKRPKHHKLSEGTEDILLGVFYALAIVIIMVMSYVLMSWIRGKL